ncbi:MAG: hypothetical protein P1U58_11800 [Verrucomicrobiales bacterium]|nr:hypothetical protein [Verrucomicrobiales bacterium]
MLSNRLLNLLLASLFISTPSLLFSQDDAARSAQGNEERVDLTTRPTPEKGATQVTARMIILNIEQIKGAEQSFTADIAFEAIWQDDRLKHNNKEKITKKLSEIWHPDFQILNRQRVQTTFPEDAEISANGEVRYIQRVWGMFSQALQLKDFPFDTQKLEVTLLSPGNSPGSVLIQENAENPSRVSDTFSIADWEMVAWKSGATELPLFSGNGSIPSFHTSVTMKRDSGYYFINVILPLFLIICMSWIVFWIPSSQMGPRISVSVTAMLTLTAYRFAIGASLPKIAYLTRLDWFILGSSILVFISLIEVVVTSALVEKERQTLARKINHSMRWVAPTAFLLLALLSLF